MKVHVLNLQGYVTQQGFNDKAHYLLDKFSHLVENITLNVCLTIDLIYEPTGCMVHLGPEHMRFIYQVCTVLLNTSMVVFYVIGVHSSELIPKIKFVNYLLKGRGY